MITNNALVAAGVDGAIDHADSATAAIQLAALEPTKRQVPLQLVCGYPRLTDWKRHDAFDGANRADRDATRTTLLPETIAGALVAASTNAPVVVVPAASGSAQNPPRPRRVDAGTDGSARAGDAMEFAGGNR